jgi:glutamate--cysteine ligase
LLGGGALHRSFFDPAALDQAEVFAARRATRSFRGAPGARRARPRAKIGKRQARDIALELLAIAKAGLVRRARISAAGNDESVHLARLADLNESGRSPADLLLEGLTNDDPDLTSEIIARTRI